MFFLVAWESRFECTHPFLEPFLISVKPTKRTLKHVVPQKNNLLILMAVHGWLEVIGHFSERPRGTTYNKYIHVNNMILRTIVFFFFQNLNNVMKFNPCFWVVTGHTNLILPSGILPSNVCTHGLQYINCVSNSLQEAKDISYLKFAKSLNILLLNWPNLSPYVHSLSNHTHHCKS